jgi:FkbM family methyltransferase
MLAPTLDLQYDRETVARLLRRQPVMLFGAGKLGRHILDLLRRAGVQPVAFLDNHRAGTTIDGLPVWTPAEGARIHGANGVAVTASWRPATTGGMADMRLQLLSLGCETVIPFPWVLWTFDGPAHYLWDDPAKLDAEREAIAAAGLLFHDEASRDLFRRQVAFRETADASILPPLATHPQYFPEFLERHPRECFIDCGAYTGDSLAALHQWHPDFAQAAAFEADPATFRTLEKFTQETGIASRVVCHPFAVGAIKTIVRFSANGGSDAAVTEDGGIEVPAVPIDLMLNGSNATFIKMDIEGAETQALLGARETIRRCDPVLAICVYHRQGDLWRIPLLMRELLPGAALLLRSYCLDGLETVCYAVPRWRLLEPR